jgi:uncharacterized protein
MNHQAFSRKGGKARSQAKTLANRAKAVAFWKAVRAGDKPAPSRLRLPPQPEEIGRLLASYCRENGINRLEVFGSTARGDASPGSDVDLLATFERVPGLRFYGMEEEIKEILGVPVHLLTRDAVERMTNPYRRSSILQDATVIYRG